MCCAAGLRGVLAFTIVWVARRGFSCVLALDPAVSCICTAGCSHDRAGSGDQEITEMSVMSGRGTQKQ